MTCGAWMIVYMKEVTEGTEGTEGAEGSALLLLL